MLRAVAGFRRNSSSPKVLLALLAMLFAVTSVVVRIIHHSDASSDPSKIFSPFSGPVIVGSSPTVGINVERGSTLLEQGFPVFNQPSCYASSLAVSASLIPFELCLVQAIGSFGGLQENSPLLRRRALARGDAENSTLLTDGSERL